MVLFFPKPKIFQQFKRMSMIQHSCFLPTLISLISSITVLSVTTLHYSIYFQSLWRVSKWLLVMGYGRSLEWLLSICFLFLFFWPGGSSRVIVKYIVQKQSLSDYNLVCLPLAFITEIREKCLRRKFGLRTDWRRKGMGMMNSHFNMFWLGLDGAAGRHSDGHLYIWLLYHKWITNRAVREWYNIFIFFSF